MHLAAEKKEERGTLKVKSRGKHRDKQRVSADTSICADARRFCN
jgi:hypothetical protein